MKAVLLLRASVLDPKGAGIQAASPWSLPALLCRTIEPCRLGYHNPRNLLKDGQALGTDGDMEATQ